MISPNDRPGIGVILAAGRGSRMGGSKQLTLWPTPAGRIPLVAAAYDAVRLICDEMVVVLGHEADTVASALGERAFRRAKSNPETPMFESIREGLRAARRIDPNRIVVLQPGDHPEVARNTLLALHTWSCWRPFQAIVPEYGGRGGHPILIPPSIASHILAADCPAGLGQFWLDNPNLCVRVPVDDPSILRDIDTPNDLPL